MYRIRFARIVGLLVVCGAVLVAGAARARAAAPDIYVTYDTTCHFSMNLAGTTAITSGTSIPYGSYEVVVSTPFSLSAGGASCDAIDFSLTGPGVSYTTTLGDGDGDEDTADATFQANSSYTAADTSVTPGTSISFSTTGTQAGSVSAPGSSSSGTSSSGGSQSALGGGVTVPSTTKATPFEGTLGGGVSAAGKLSLKFKGKPVATLKPGDYTLSVSDKSSKAGFYVARSGHAATTVTSTSFKGSHSQTLDLTTGQWDFYAKPGGAKTYFIVET